VERLVQDRVQHPNDVPLRTWASVETRKELGDVAGLNPADSAMTRRRNEMLTQDAFVSGACLQFDVKRVQPSSRDAGERGLAVIARSPPRPISEHLVQVVLRTLLLVERL